MKRCSRCKKEKDENEFYKDKHRPDGLCCSCKECQQEYRNNNKEKKRKHYLDHREEKLEKQKIYQKEHKEERKEYHKDYGPKHHIKNKHTPKYRYRRYKADAKRRGREFDLTLEQFESLVVQPCFYCNDSESLIGIDRINNEIGYKIENCTPCCRICNVAKNIISYEEWIDYIMQLIKYKLNEQIRIIERNVKHKLLRQQYNNYKNTAIRKNIVFNISFEQFKEFCETPCNYCGTITKIFVGIDRINNNIGYEIENCTPCCKICNSGKNNNLYEVWLAWIDRIVEHNRGLII